MVEHSPLNVRLTFNCDNHHFHTIVMVEYSEVPTNMDYLSVIADFRVVLRVLNYWKLYVR